MAVKYYDISNMLATDAEYMMLLGQRANGKSYQAKKTVLENAVKGGKFVYLRRWQADIKQSTVASYFGDMDIPKLTKGMYDGIEAWHGFIYFTIINEKGESVKAQEIGRYCALNEYERYKSQVFDATYKYILYEEFITDAVYLDEEPRLLQQFVSTVARHRKMNVLLIGNTLSRVCPYFAEWCLEGVLKQKQGTIEVYHFHMEEATINIAVEMCANAQAENKMFFGQTAKQIVTGEWDTTDVPKLPRPQSEYEKVYEVEVEYQKFKFIIELLVEPKDGGVLCFVYPFTGRRYVHRKITNEFSDLPNISARLDLSKRPEALMANAFRLGKVCYSDNLTGSDFRHVNEHFKIGTLV